MNIDFEITFTPSLLLKLLPDGEESDSFSDLAREAVKQVCELSGGTWETTANFSSDSPQPVQIRNAVRQKVESNLVAIRELCIPQIQMA